MATPTPWLRLRAFARKSCGAAPKLAGNSRGAATVEFALIFGILVVVMLNGTEIARWYNSKMELDNATEMAVQAVTTTCDSTHLPATTACPTYNTVISTALASTTLGSLVVQTGGSPADSYYCLNASGQLVFLSSIATAQTTCTAAGNANLVPSEYVTIQASYSYTPIFSAVTIGSLLPSSLKSFAMVRLK